MSDKYHATLDLYQKLCKNFSLLETELEQKKNEICALKAQAATKFGSISVFNEETKRLNDVATGVNTNSSKNKRGKSESNGDVYLNLDLIQDERSLLSGKTYEAARVFFTKRGR